MIGKDPQIWALLPVPALIIDAEDRIAAINPAAEMFLNTTSRTVIGTPLFERLLFAADMEVALARVRSTASPVFINDVDSGPGDRPPAHCNLQLAPMEDQAVLLVIAPRDLAGRIERSQSSQSAAKSAIGMAEMLAHEIKNPLAGITGAAQLLSMNLTDDDRELTDLIVAETRRVVKLLEQVEQFGNLRPPRCAPVNIHDLLDRARKSAAIGFASHMDFREDYDPSLPLTWADGDQILQVLLNLIKNAAQATGGEPGSIRLRTFYDASLRVRRNGAAPARVPLQIEILDDGPGIPEAIADDIFEPFVSGRENGTGLGLALVSKIMSDHNGWISVDSVPGRTAIRLSLPVAPADTPPQEETD